MGNLKQPIEFEFKVKVSTCSLSDINSASYAINYPPESVLRRHICVSETKSLRYPSWTPNKFDKGPMGYLLKNDGSK